MERQMKEFTKDELEIAKICLVKKMNKLVRVSKGCYCAEDVMFYINKKSLTNEIVKNLNEMLAKATKWIEENKCRHIVESLIKKLK